MADQQQRAGNELAAQLVAYPFLGEGALIKVEDDVLARPRAEEVTVHDPQPSAIDEVGEGAPCPVTDLHHPFVVLDPDSVGAEQVGEEEHPSVAAVEVEEADPRGEMVLEGRQQVFQQDRVEEALVEGISFDRKVIWLLGSASTSAGICSAPAAISASRSAG